MMNPSWIGWVIVGQITIILISALAGRLSVKNKCETCGIADLKAEIIRLCNLVKALAEKSGMTVKEQLEIEKLSEKDN